MNLTCLSQITMGPFKDYVTGLGGGGSSKIVTKCDIGGESKSKSDVIASNKYYFRNRVFIDLCSFLPKFYISFRKYRKIPNVSPPRIEAPLNISPPNH